MLESDVELVATWAGVVRVVALHRPVQVLLDGATQTTGMLKLEAIAILVAGVALIYAAFLGTGGRAWFGTREDPSRILGERLRFVWVEGPPPGPHDLPDAVVRDFQTDGYRIEFERPVIFAGHRVAAARISARAMGYPISRARKRRRVSVAGET